MYCLLLFLFIPLISARPPVTVVELDKYYNILYTDVMNQFIKLPVVNYDINSIWIYDLNAFVDLTQDITKTEFRVIYWYDIDVDTVTTIPKQAKAVCKALKQEMIVPPQFKFTDCTWGLGIDANPGYFMTFLVDNNFVYKLSIE